MRNMIKKDKLIQLCILMVIYIGFTVFIAGRDIREFKRSKGEVVLATIKSTSINSESHRSGRRRHTEITQTAKVEFTYNGETQTATVYKPFTKKVGDKIRLGITEDGRILVLYMKFDLTFFIITVIFIGFLIVSWMRSMNQKEQSKMRDSVLDTHTIKFEDNIYTNDEPRANQHEYDMYDMNKSMLKADIQTAAMIAQHEKNSHFEYDKKVVDEVPKLKFELKKPLNHEKDPGENE